MTRYHYLAQGPAAGAILKTLARMTFRAMCAFVLGFILIACKAPAPAGNSLSGTMTIVLKREIGAGGSVSVDLDPTYAYEYSACGFGATLASNNSKILVTLPESACMPDVDMECATITAVEVDGTVAAVYMIVAVDGGWEVILGEL